MVVAVGYSGLEVLRGIDCSLRRWLVFSNVCIEIGFICWLWGWKSFLLQGAENVGFWST